MAFLTCLKSVEKKKHYLKSIEKHCLWNEEGIALAHKDMKDSTHTDQHDLSCKNH